MLESYKYQTNCTQEFKNKLWDKIIKNKIYNQATVLEYAKVDYSSSVLAMIDKVAQGDKLNIEAQVAQTYWKSIFQDSFHYFTRNMSDVRNSALNYGYAIIRSIISNTLSCKGFIFSLAIRNASRSCVFSCST